MTDQKGKGGIKIVIINTQYVQTDPKSFKSVVQKLTGKDSKVPGSPDAANCTAAAAAGGARSGVGDLGSMSRNFSFKYDLDRMLKEMPTVNEFNSLWSN